jgi:general L-amino acid transport system permease protein
MTQAGLISAAEVGSGRARRPPPLVASGAYQWARQRFFANGWSAAVSLLVIAALVLWLPPILRWAVMDAVWYTEDPARCRTATGACWAIVPEKYRVILFGTYPPEERWRGALVIAAVIGLSVVSSFRRLWSMRLFYTWVGAGIAVLILMSGGVFGLRPVGTHDWGGLPLTFILFVGTVVGGLPLAILLALGRGSRLPVLRAFCVALIEFVRGVPLLAVLFIASVLFPLFVPQQLTIDKLLRAQGGMIVFFAAYAAETVRGGLQAIPRGQYEAAAATGLTYWQSQRKIILPQALRIVIPALMNDIIRAFKNTTFVSIIGLFDVLGATKAAVQDLRWIAYASEAYIFVFALYFVFCFAMSKYSEGIEAELARGRRY